MSKTYRRKNFEAEEQGSWRRQGRKIAGFYAVTGWRHTIVDGELESVYEMRAPTPEEFKRKRYWAHGESRHSNDRSPSHWYRNNRMRQNRALTRQELARFVKYEEYEPMVECEPRSCLWDWR